MTDRFGEGGDKENARTIRQTSGGKGVGRRISGGVGGMIGQASFGRWGWVLLGRGMGGVKTGDADGGGGYRVRGANDG